MSGSGLYTEALLESGHWRVVQSVGSKSSYSTSSRQYGEYGEQNSTMICMTHAFGIWEGTGSICVSYRVWQK